MKVIGHFVNGREINSSSKRTADIFNPATGEIQSRVSLGLASELDEAVEKAKAALLPVIEAVKETASQLDASMTADDVTGIYGDGYSRQELQTSTTSLLGSPIT